MDKVFIENLEIETIIGIFGWEREVKQIVRISLEMSFNISKAGKSDSAKAISFLPNSAKEISATL